MRLGKVLILDYLIVQKGVGFELTGLSLFWRNSGKEGSFPLNRIFSEGREHRNFLGLKKGSELGLQQEGEPLSIWVSLKSFFQFQKAWLSFGLKSDFGPLWNPLSCGNYGRSFSPFWDPFLGNTFLTQFWLGRHNLFSGGDFLTRA